MRLVLQMVKRALVLLAATAMLGTAREVPVHREHAPEDYDPEKAMDFFSYKLDEDTALEGMRTMREQGLEPRNNVMEKPAIVPFGRVQTLNGTWTLDRARSFVYGSLDQNMANWILYPYYFEYIAPPLTSSELAWEEQQRASASSSSFEPWRQGNETLLDGAMLSTMDTENFPLHTYINWIQSKTNIDIKKAKAVYDVNIAILQVEVDEFNEEEGESFPRDYTSDSHNYCTMFYTTLYPKYEQCFVGQAKYDEWAQKNPTKTGQPIVMYVSPGDLANGTLQTSSGENRFGILIMPDVMMNRLSNVKSLIEPAKEEITAFVNAGGVVYTTGKSAFLLETLGLVSPGTFNGTHTLISPSRDYQFIEGCDNTRGAEPADDSHDEFVRSTLCFSLPYLSANGDPIDAFTSGPQLAKRTGHGFTELLWFKTNDNVLMVHDEGTGVNSKLDLTANRSYPAVMYKKYGTGYIVVNAGNPYRRSTQQHVYNAMMLAGSRPVALDNVLVGVPNRTVPALEQVDLSVTLNVINYFTDSIEQVSSMKVYTIKGTIVTTGDCQEDTSAIPPESLKNITDKVLTCSLGSLAERSKKSLTFSVRIDDPLVTQQKQDVPILWPELKYVDPTTGRSVVVSYSVKVQAAASALLRAEMNIDPSSQYPLHCQGSYIDNVLNCENKEETEAKRVLQTSIVPIISPLIDINDQIRLTNAMVLDKAYYTKEVNSVGLWKFPFSDAGGTEREADYLDWDRLCERGDALAADWDEGVKISRVTRSSLKLAERTGIVPGECVMNANYQTNNDDDVFVLRQYQFDDSDKFYEHAVQRLMAFLDVNTEIGAKTYWNGTIPAGEAMASDPNRGKLRVLFVRHDIFWWKKYLMPFGITDRTTYLTLDRYAKKGKCNDTKARSVQGQFGNDVEDGMIPAEYPNELALECNTEVDVNDVENYSGGKVKLVHYIVPVDPRDANVSGDLYNFDDQGQYKDYPEVKFVQVYAAKFDVAPEDTRRGGDLKFKFDTSGLPWDSVEQAIANDKITVAADQIAVYEMRAEGTNTLVIRFKRGQMPNEAYGQASHLQVFFEDVTKWSGDKTVSVEVYEMHYDLGKADQSYEDWSTKTNTITVNFKKQGALSMPAVKLQFAINDDVEKSSMNPYELREPLVRYGLYEQELLAHRAVHGSAEFHPISEPCIVTRNSGFSTFTHVGTSSVPFREYVSTGTSLQIPAASETGRIEWDDIWGRHFVQNVRSTIFEYPPIPPPLRNFVMTTTFELLDKYGNRMLGGWRSNQEADVHVQMKLLNNYPKWFEITTCLDNRVLQSCVVDGKECGKARVYDTDNNFVAPDGEDNGMQYFARGQNASYGICFRDADVILQGVGPLTEEQRQKIQQMTLCAKSFGDDDRSCEKAADDLPNLTKADENSAVTGSKWNYAKQVEDYWPRGYIKDNMWDMTHYDYDDNQFDKAYKYHMDNNLPHLGHTNTRPDNLIAFPLYKGLGYSMEYDKTYSNPNWRLSKYKGWWSNNLQNRDHTLTAGNDHVNDISVGKDSLIPESELYDIANVQNGDKVVAEAEKNVYTCHFNRRNVKNYVSNTRVSQLHNVYENNVVPVPIDFNDEMEFRYQCNRSEWYTPTNISQYPNTVYTDTARDWLYFAANLRGGALEDINVIYKLSPLDTDAIKFEGQAKVQDGGRFTYWNPANSKNSYLIVDSPVHVVLARRNDIEIEQELIPTYTTTFDSVLYHHLTVSDPEEIEREWDMDIWTDNYGYGDFTVQVYVGDAGTTALPQPGQTIRARVTFMNNAGFDINMLKEAITSSEVSQEAINSYDKMMGLVHTLRTPEAYNFMKIDVPPEIAPYVNITPCKEVVGIAGLFFDFDSINVVTIRDGWKGDYYYNIEVKSNFPDEYRGRLNQINLTLVEKYFDRLPGSGDETGVHDYKIEIPPLMIGVPYGSGPWAGKVFYTSGYATQVDVRTAVSKPFEPDQAIIVSEADLEQYRHCINTFGTNPNDTQITGEYQCLDNLWAEHLKDHQVCDMSVVENNTERTVVSFVPCFEQIAPTFPVQVAPADGPDTATIHILLRTRAPQCKSGYPLATEYVQCSYKDWSNATMNSPSVWGRTVHAKGAWLELKWSMSLLSSSGMPLSNQLLSPKDSGLANVSITLSNTGDQDAYNTRFNLTIPADITIATNETDLAGLDPIPDGCVVEPLDNGETMFACDVALIMTTGTAYTYVFYVHYEPDTREGAGPDAKAPLNMHIMAKSSSASIDLTAAAGEKRVTQDLEGPYGFTYTSDIDTNMVVLTGQRSSGYDVLLKASHKLAGITRYLWRAKLPDSTIWTTFAVTTGSTLDEDVHKRFEELGGSASDEVAVDYVVAVTDSTKKTILPNTTVEIVTQSNVYEWRVAESNLLLLLLLLPGIAVPAAAAALIFAKTKGSNKAPVQDLGLPTKQKFVPQELVDDEPVGVTEMDESLPPPPLPQREAPVYTPPEPPAAAPAFEQPEPPVHMAEPGKTYAVPTGPTYLRAGVGVNVVDTARP